MSSLTKSKKNSKNSHSKPNAPDHPTLAVHVAGERKNVDPLQLLDDDFANQFQKELESADEPAVFYLTKLLDFDDKARWGILNFISGLHRCSLKVGKGEFSDLFEAALALLTDNSNMSRYKNAKMAALEAAVVRYPDALDGACDRICKRFRELKMKGVRVADLRSEANKILGKLQKQPLDDEQLKQRTVKEVFPDASFPSDVLLPASWNVSADGIKKIGNDDGAASIPHPVIITERSRNIQTGTELVTIAWLRDGKWTIQIVERKVIASSRLIVDLAALGVPVTSNNARTLVQYLADFEAQNLDRLPVAKVSHQMGWQGAKKNGFLWGKNFITAKGLVAKNSPPPKGGHVLFRGTDVGDEQLADGFHEAGTYEGWKKAVRLLRPFPRAMVSLYTTFVPPLLPIFYSPNFIIDFAGETTIGKTTCLRIAASGWGSPAERGQGGGIIASWNSTLTWRERAAAVTRHLPFFLDETKHVRFPNEVANTIYGYAQGGSRGRGTIHGTAPQDLCEGVMFISGEQSATSSTEDGGTRARVLTFWGSPFGAVNEQTGNRVRRINRILAENYGHAGPRFVRYLQQNRAQWDEWRTQYNEWVKIYVEWAGENTVAGRMAAPFAAITMASWLAYDTALGLSDWSNPFQTDTLAIGPVWEELTQEAGEADRAMAALRHVVSWAGVHRENFYRWGDGGRNQPHDGWAGRWDDKSKVNPGDEPGDWKYIAFVQHILEKVLREAKFDPDPIIRTWKDRGWLKTSEAQRNQFKVKIGENVVWAYAVTREAVDAVTD